MKKPFTINEIKLSYRKQEFFTKRITSSMDAYNISREIMLKDECEPELKEYFYIMLLNRNHNVTGYYKLSEGGITGTVADIRIAFATALKSAAVAMILFHNHPSGNMKPSEQDCGLTKKFKESGKLLDVEVLDHLIISLSSYYSFADEGMM